MAVRWPWKKMSRPVTVFVQVGVLGVILASLGTVGFIEYSAQPGFCDNCHLMKPYYESWATSSHNDVKCIQCHYAPGIKAEAMGKVQAANQVVKYVTGAYGTKPWAEVEDAACLRSGCHSLRKVEGVVNYNGVRFDHTKHLGELRRGKQLRCTSCHSQIVQGDHLSVTPITCNLCHFKDREPGDPIAGCVSCHTEPPRVVSPAGFVVDHPQYVQDLVSCVSCHKQVTSGTGRADQDRCYNCHNTPERLDEFENTTLVHRVHIAEHNVECTQCHTPIQHELVSLTQSVALDCAACHQRVHEVQQRLYAGFGGHRTEDTPSAMFLARVSCQGCHELPKSIAGHETVNLAGEASCMSCHGIRYANMLPTWQAEVDRKVAAVDRVVRGAHRAAGSIGLRDRATVDSLLQLAGENVDFVREGRGAHNVAYADRLLRASVTLVEEAVNVGLSYAVPAVDLGPEVAENICLQCHVGVERTTVTFDGGPFDHERHAIDGAIACESCHSSLDDHGRTLFTSRADCASCHHREIDALNCAQCHEGPGGAPVDSIPVSAGTFLHAPHREAGFDCAMCHSAPAMDASGVDCVMCHDFHHQPAASCSLCHQGVQEKHDVSFAHTQCSMCHGTKVAGIAEWSRQVCLTCHVDRVDHNAPADCDLCHEVAPLKPSEP